jgi:putative transcriptional regulator
MAIRYKIDVLDALKTAGYSTYRLRKDKLLGQSQMQLIRDGTVVYGDCLNKLCELLNLQPGDIIEYIPDDND